jgi:hypothetical protein
MAWSTGFGLSVILAIFGAITFAAYRVYSTVKKSGADGEKLKEEQARREILEKIDQIEDEEEQKLHENILSISDLSWVERKRMLQQGESPDSGGDSTEETTA